MLRFLMGAYGLAPLAFGPKYSCRSTWCEAGRGQIAVGFVDLATG